MRAPSVFLLGLLALPATPAMSQTAWAIHAGPRYHTTGDVFETISVEGLERAARFCTFFIERVAAASWARIDP